MPRILWRAAGDDRCPLRGLRQDVAGAVEASFAVSDTKLCIGGVDFGGHYQVSVLAGLPNADEDKLAKQENVDFLVGDSEPSLGFKSATYVLPQVGSTACRSTASM